MLQTEMSTKMLNVEKLEKKFASLTRSRESIQGLSMWIIRHKDCYKEIVNQWLDALTRDLNALTMFYVANDVIQNCGRKKAPEFREAFASVLEKAVSLQKVKEIKNEVTRMLTLWHDRSIYDDEFFKRLEGKLNAAIDIESEKEELSDAEIIANFKLENLINSLKKLRTLEEELLEKETFLDDIEEPGMCNIDNLIVKMESQKELRKFDKFQKLVEDYISLSDKVMAAKKTALLNLKYSSIFYNAQMEDAKKVAHAYRIYGKKVKMVEKSLCEKIPTLPEQTFSPKSCTPDPCTELNLSQESLGISTFINDKSSEENDLEVSVSPQKNESELIDNSFDKKCKSIADKISISPSADCISIIPIEKSLDNFGKSVKTLHLSNEDLAKDDSPSEVTESLSHKIAENSVSNKASDSEIQALPDVECIDFLLEKAYDKQVKCSKLSFKRKIDNLLKLKQAKSCKLANDEDILNTKLLPALSEDKILSESMSPDNKTFLESVASENHIQAVSCTVSKNNILDEIKTERSNSPVPKECVTNAKSTNNGENVHITSDEITNVQSTSHSKNVNKTSNVEKTENFNDEPVKLIQGLQVSNTNDSKNDPSSNSFAFQTLPDIPTELLKNILDKHRINMNISSNADSCLNTSAMDSARENNDQSVLSHIVNNDFKIANDIQSFVPKISGADCLKSTNSDVKSTSQELVDNTSNGTKQPVFSMNLLSDFDKFKKKNHDINSTHFLENLQKVLECFTKKETCFKELKYSKTVSALPSIPLENSLKIYNCIMQNNNKIDCFKNEPSNSSSFNGNTVSYSTSKEFMNNERFCSNETSTNLNLKRTASFANKESSISLDKNKTEFTEYSIDSKTDNMEIMDMELDSEDENTE